MPPDAVAELSAAVLGKTDGNPYFIGQFLGGLDRDGLLRYSPAGQRWTWLLARIQALPATDNVADIMLAKLRHLSPPAMTLLQTAACVGVQFELDTVAQLCAMSHGERSEALAVGAVTRYQLSVEYRRVLPDVYVPKRAALTLDDQIRAGWLWSHRRGTVCGLSAAGMHGARWVDCSLPHNPWTTRGR